MSFFVKMSNYLRLNHHRSRFFVFLGELSTVTAGPGFPMGTSCDTEARRREAWKLLKRELDFLCIERFSEDVKRERDLSC